MMGRAKAAGAAAMAERKRRTRKVDVRKGDRHKGRRKSGQKKKGTRKGTWKGKGTCNCKSADSETVQTLRAELQKANDKIAELEKIHEWERKWRMYYEGCVRNPRPPA